MPDYHVYLLKQAVLWSASRRGLGSMLARNQAKRMGVKIVQQKTPGSSQSPASYDLSTRQLRIDPGSSRAMESALLPHELDEARYYRPGGRGVTSLPPRLVPVWSRLTRIPERLAEHPGTKKMQQQLASSVEGFHTDPRVLLDESYRIASRQVEPEAANWLMGARRSSGEADALRRIGISFGHTTAQPGGRAYTRALDKFKQQYGTAHPGLYNMRSGIEPARKNREAQWKKTHPVKITEEILSPEEALKLFPHLGAS